MSKGKILRVKQGYNPNSSSIGSVIFSMAAAVVPASIVVGMVASAISTAILERVGGSGPEKSKNRSPRSEEADFQKKS